MSRVSTLWILVAASILIGVGLFRLSRPVGETLEAPPGLWGPARSEPRQLSLEQRELIARLEALGYLEGSELPSGLESVSLHLPEFAQPGWNLLTSGHAPEAQLRDMDGRLLHRWSYPFRKAFPNHSAPRTHSGAAYWRRVHLFENGDLLAIYDDYGLIKLDAQSKLIWAVAGGFHHDLSVDARGHIFVLSQQSQLVQRLDPDEPVLLDFIVELNADGEMLRRVPILEAIERSKFTSLLESRPDHADIFHTNTLEIFDGSHADLSPNFRQGNALISLRSLHAIAIVDLRQERLVWASTGPWIFQHQPTLLANGNMLLFDNLGHEGMSKVIEFDPRTLEIAWHYHGSAENGFSSEKGGSNQRLPNGNTLITESDSGRAFEVTREGVVVWEYHSQARAGPNDEFVAYLCEVIRLPADFPTQWMQGAGRDS